MENSKRWLPYALASLIFSALSATLCLKLGSRDPDYYFHLAIARLSAQQSELLRSLPQITGLGWQFYFPDKEFLFHQLLKFAFLLGGQNAVVAVVPILGGLNCLLIGALLRNYLSWPIGSALTLALITTQSFVWRMSMLRPQILAVFFFLILLLAVQKRRKYLVLLAAMAFALSYHSFYILFLPLGLSLIFKRKDLLCFGLLGLAIGICINPYFPSNIQMSLRHLQIALFEARSSPQDFGAELAPADVLFFVVQHLGLLASFIYASILLYRQRTNELLYLWLLSLTFWLVSLANPRGVEYAVPISFVLAAYSLQKQSPRKAWLILLAFVALQTSCLWSIGQKLIAPAVPSWEPAIAATLNAVPAGARIFTCDWSDGSYILYSRPDLSFPDVLDPSFLRQANPPLYTIREGIHRGATPPAALLQNFDYVFCRRRLAALEQAPYLKNLSQRAPYLFLITSAQPTSP